MGVSVGVGLLMEVGLGVDEAVVVGKGEEVAVGLSVAVAVDTAVGVSVALNLATSTFTAVGVLAGALSTARMLWQAASHNIIRQNIGKVMTR